MRVLVTGAAGFIGSHVAEALLLRGDEVLGIDDLNDYYNPARKEENLALLRGHARFSFLRADICDAAAMDEAFAAFRPERVVHLAARAGVRPSVAAPARYYATNVLGTLALLEASRARGARVFIFASSSSVYGERYGGRFSESDRVDTPCSPYAATKKAGEELCHVYHGLYGLRVTCLRFFTVYGPRGRPDMAPYKFMKAIIAGEPLTKYGDGSSARGYTFVADVVAGVLAALDRGLQYEIINIGSDTAVTLNEFIATLERATGRKARIALLSPQPGDVPYTCADLAKARKLLDYEPRTALADGLHAFAAWYGADHA